MITIYCDMDGVLCDFYSVYTELKRKHNVTERGYVWKFFSKMVKEEKIFSNLPMLPNASYLLNYLREVEFQYKGNVAIKILTSGGDRSGIAHYEEAKRQKEEWLKKHNINWEVITVKRKEEKAAYANSNSILIDDTKSNVDEFNEAGGHGVLYTDGTIISAVMTVSDLILKIR